MHRLNKLQTLMQQYTVSARKAQARYKHNFDRHLRSQIYYPEPGSHVFVRKDYKEAQMEKDKSSWKLIERSDGSYFVQRLLSTTAEVQIGDEVEYVNQDRLSSATAIILSDLAGSSPSKILSEVKHSGDMEYFVRGVYKHRVVREKGISKHKPWYEYKAFWYNR